MVFNAIKNYGHEEQKKKLIAGIVLTGGGSQLKHIKQLVEYITGMDTRIGYPNEHLAGDSDERIASPIYATSVGLVMSAIKNNVSDFETEIYTDDEKHNPEVKLTLEEKLEQEQKEEEKKKNKGFLEHFKFLDSIKNFLDSAE